MTANRLVYSTISKTAFYRLSPAKGFYDCEGSYFFPYTYAQKNKISFFNYFAGILPLFMLKNGRIIFSVIRITEVFENVAEEQEYH